jgi:small GTP-binding protein
MENIKKTIKILLLGDAGVGKTTIVNSFITNKYVEDMGSTIGLDYKSKVLNGINFQMYDTSGQERFKMLVNSYYKQTDIVVFIFSLDNIKSLENIENSWIPNTNKHYDNDNNKPKYILVGNKSDKIYDKCILHKIKSIITKFNIHYYDVSAKTLCNINELFDKIYKYSNTNDTYTLVNIKNKKNINLSANNTIDEDNLLKECCIIS